MPNDKPYMENAGCWKAPRVLPSASSAEPFCSPSTTGCIHSFVGRKMP